MFTRLLVANTCVSSDQAPKRVAERVKNEAYLMTLPFVISKKKQKNVEAKKKNRNIGKADGSVDIFF
jgi:hypothetical protein